MGITAWGGSRRIAQVCNSVISVFGDAWHKATTRPTPGIGAPGPTAARTGQHRPRPPPTLRAVVPLSVAADLARLLERHSRDHAGVASLRTVDSALRQSGGSFEALSDAVLRQALTELRWLARQQKRTPSLARVTDQVQRQVVERELRGFLLTVRAPAPPGSAARR